MMSEQNSETQLEEQQNTELQTESPDPNKPPTSEQEVVNKPVVPITAPMDARTRDALNETIRENVRLREELAARNAPVISEDPKDFFDNPHKATREIIQREIKQAIDPLTKFAQSMQTRDTLATMRQQYSTNPIYNKVAPVVEQIMQGQPATEEAFKAAFYAASGMYYNNDLAPYGIPFEAPTNAPAPRSPNTSVPNMRPAIMSPTPPGVPKSPDSTNRRPLTESERVNMVRFGLSEDEAYAALGIGDEQGAGDIDTLRKRFPTKQKETK
jgi:hypothetical protein